MGSPACKGGGLGEATIYGVYMDSLKGKLTEDEAREIIKNYILIDDEDGWYIDEDESVERLKEKGYIKEPDYLGRALEIVNGLIETHETGKWMPPAYDELKEGVTRAM
jgi:hypothetical protein